MGHPAVRVDATPSARSASHNAIPGDRAPAASDPGTVAFALVSELARLGVREVFGLHGGPLLPVLEAVEQA